MQQTVSRQLATLPAFAAAALLAMAALLVPDQARAQAFGFGPLAPLNSNAATDGGQDNQPQLTTDGAGTWIAVWGSDDTIGGTIGADRDILLSVSFDVPVELSAFALD